MASDIVGLDKLLGGFSVASLKAGTMDIVQYVIWGLAILAVGFFIWKRYQDKKVYIYPVRIFRRRANGMMKEMNTFGGYIIQNGVTKFSIKMGRIKKRKLDRLPDSSLMDEEDRVYFNQLSPDAPLIQCKKIFKIEPVLVPNEKYVEPSIQEKENLINRYIMELKLEEECKDKADDEIKLIATQMLEAQIENEKLKQVDVTNVYYTPVPTDQKLQMASEMKNYRTTLGVDVNKQFAYFIIGVIAIIILGAIIFYIAVNQGDIPILTK